MSAARVVSLVPSVTETLVAWSRPPIACTRFCGRADLEHVGGTKDPHVERVVELAPDLVVMDEEENRREDYEALVERGVRVLALGVRSLEGVAEALGALAAALEVPYAAPDLPRAAPARRRAFVPIWRRPWMALGAPTYAASLLESLGVSSVVANDGPYVAIDLEEARRRAPSCVLAPSEPYPFGERHRGELERVAPVTLVDGRDLFWWGARTLDARRRLARVLGSLEG